MTLVRTPSQTVGPFFGFALPWPAGPFVVPEGMPGAIWIRGVIRDGLGEPIPDGLIETWQADATGRFRHPDDPGDAPGRADFRGFGRSATDQEGRGAILTIKPGAVVGADGRLEAPHIDVSVFARGLLKRLVTRIYFADEGGVNATDPVLMGLSDPAERATLVAEPTDDGYRFDIRLQGERETVFFDI